MIKEHLVRKLPSYGRYSWSALPPSRQPCHHVNHIIMSTTHQQVVGKRNSSETCDFTGENTLRETPCFFGKVTPGVAKGGSLLTRAWFALQNRQKKWWDRSTLGGWGRQNVHQTVPVARDSFPIKIAKNWHVRGTQNICTTWTYSSDLWRHFLSREKDRALDVSRVMSPKRLS